MSKCCDNETQCETECSSGSCSTEGCKPSCGSDEGCPIDHAAECWKSSFFQAMREVQVDILKAKILKAHGPMLDKAADALLETVSAHWQAKVSQVKAAEACHGFKEKLRDLWLAENKK
jgi:hypothetical protein